MKLLVKNILCAIIATAALSSMALAHDAPKGWSYDPWCCNGVDCAEISQRNVKIVKGGYQVTVDAGDHPMVTKRHEFFVPQKDAKPSPDGEYHLCLWPTEDTLRCFYAGPMGF